MDKYKEKLESLAMSAQILQKIEDVANRHDLNLDQTGEMVAEVRDVITEVVPTSEFTKELAQRLEISDIKARDITIDIDKEVFKAIKSLMQQFMEIDQIVSEDPKKKTPTPAPAPTPMNASEMIKPVERAGNFEVHQTPSSSSTLYNDNNLSKEDVLADLENIKNLQPENSHTYIEHLIEPAPQTSEPEPVTEQQVIPPPPPVPPPPPKPSVPPPVIPQQPKPEGKHYETDPYREPV